MDDVHGAAPRQDFEPIRLWYVNKEQSYPFCNDLLKNMLAAKDLPLDGAEKIFGRSVFSGEEDGWQGVGTAYRAESAVGRQFQRLAASDPSFQDYLRRRGIDLRRMHELEADQRAADLRKARSVVALREYFKGVGKDLSRDRAQGRRSRKVPTVYGGATSLFAMVEGNPRWFIGIIGELLSRAKSGKLIPKPAQVRQVLDAADIFRAMLKTIPSGRVGQSKRGLLSLLDPIGQHFSYAAIDGPFDPDPPCSFVVDAATSEDDLEALGKALNAGAIVYAPGDGDVGILESLRGKRFRLSYILAPHYFIPLVLGREMSLRQILKRVRERQPLAESEPTLFELSEETHE